MPGHPASGFLVVSIAILKMATWILLLLHCTNCTDQQLTAEYVAVKLPFPASCQSPYYDGQDRIYLFGNCGFHADQILVFSISSETVDVAGYLPDVGTDGSVQADDHGNIFYFGGGPDRDKVFKFNSHSNISSTVATLPYFFYGHTSLKYNSTIVYIFGGYGDYTGIWGFDMETMDFFRLGDLPYTTHFATSVLVGNMAYIFDDVYHQGVYYQALELDMETLAMTPVGPPTLPMLSHFPASVWDDNFVYIIGGYESSSYRTDGLIKFDPDTFENIFIPVTNFMDDNTYFFVSPASVYVPNRNRIYTFGGYSFNETEYEYITQDDICYIDLTPSDPTPTTTLSTTTKPTTITPTTTTTTTPTTTTPTTTAPTTTAPTTTTPTTTTESTTTPTTTTPTTTTPTTTTPNTTAPTTTTPTTTTTTTPTTTTPTTTTPTTTTPTTTTPTTSRPTTTTDNPTPSTTSSTIPTCSNRPDGTYPHPTDCSMYIRCRNEVMTLHSCPFPLLFSPVKLTCDYPNQVDCGAA